MALGVVLGRGTGALTVDKHNYKVTDTNRDMWKEAYLELLEKGYKSSSAVKSKDENLVDIQYNRAKDWLIGTDFFDAPASTRFHEPYPCGLLVHTLMVYDSMMYLIDSPRFQSVDLGDAVVTALIHDWCKIGIYESYMRNVKNDETGVWEKVTSYKKKESPFPFGHGETSMYLGMKFFCLTEEQCLAIRWHMGKWYTPDVNDDDLSNASHKYPLVYLLQFSDQMALAEY